MAFYMLLQHEKLWLWLHDFLGQVKLPKDCMVFDGPVVGNAFCSAPGPASKTNHVPTQGHLPNQPLKLPMRLSAAHHVALSCVEHGDHIHNLSFTHPFQLENQLPPNKRG